MSMHSTLSVHHARRKYFKLHQRSPLGGGSDIVIAILSHKGSQNFDYSLLSSHRCLIMHDAKTKIVDADF